MKHSTLFTGLKLAAKAASLAVITSFIAAPATAQVLNGDFTIQQKSSGRYLDAYEGLSDNIAVTRPHESNNTQVWIFTHKGGNTYTIRQKSNGRFLDTYYTRTPGPDGVDKFKVATRNFQNSGTQLWRLNKYADGSYKITSTHNRALEGLDAANDFAALANTPNNTVQQRWIIRRVGGGPVIPPIVIPPIVVVPPVILPLPPQPQLSGTYYIQQRSNMRFMDAHEGTRDNSVVTRPFQNNNTQMWMINPLGNNIYIVRQRSSLMFMDAHEGINDNDVVTRNAQNNATQQWIIKRVGNNLYTIQQRSNGRYLDAHEAANNDFRVVTRNRQNNSTQKWVIRLVH